MFVAYFTLKIPCKKFHPQFATKVSIGRQQLSFSVSILASELMVAYIGLAVLRNSRAVLQMGALLQGYGYVIFPGDFTW